MSSSSAEPSSSPAIFSPKSHQAWLDEAATPPSSPPLTRNDDQENVAPQPVEIKQNAFSLLGKRKATTELEQKPAKKAAFRPIEKTLTQMQLSLGQRVEKRCETCGMLYVVSSAEDRGLHHQYHKRWHEGHVVGKRFVNFLTTNLENEDPALLPANHGPRTKNIHIVRVDDPLWRRKHAREVLDLMTASLGACAIADEELWHCSDDSRNCYQMFMYVKDGTCVSAVLVERRAILKTRKVVERDCGAAQSIQNLTSLERLRQRREVIETDNSATLRLSEETYDACIGISRIWTAPDFRRQHLAESLLQAVFHDLNAWPCDGLTPKSRPIDVIAFSQPTTAGTKLARRYFGQRAGWMVY